MATHLGVTFLRYLADGNLKLRDLVLLNRCSSMDSQKTHERKKSKKYRTVNPSSLSDRIYSLGVNDVSLPSPTSYGAFLVPDKKDRLKKLRNSSSVNKLMLHDQYKTIKMSPSIGILEALKDTSMDAPLKTNKNFLTPLLNSSSILGKSGENNVLETPLSRRLPVSDAWMSESFKKRSFLTESEGSDPLKGSFIQGLKLKTRYLDEIRNGNFIYLRPKKGAERTAYDLENVEHYEVNKDNYYTMSQEGVTHFMKNESEFCPLQRWEKEYKIFTLIRKIPFFQKYRLWKGYIVWKLKIGASRTEKAKKRLSNRLYLINPMLNKAILQIRDQCLMMSLWKLVHFEKGKTYSLEEFKEQQVKGRNDMIKKMNGFFSTLVELVMKICDTIVDNFLEVNRIVADHKMTFMERAALRNECRHLTNFLRLVDFLVLDSVLELAIQSMESLVVYISGDQKKGFQENPLFRINVTLEEDTIGLMPSYQTFREELEKILKDSMEIVQFPERLLGQPSLITYISACSDDDGKQMSPVEEFNALAILNDNVHYTKATANTFYALENAFKDVHEYLNQFNTYKMIYQENCQQLPLFHDTYRNVNLDKITRDIELYSQQTKEFYTIPSSCKVGILNVDSNDFKGIILPSPEKCLLEIKMLIPLLMSELSKFILTQLDQAMPIATKVPSNADEFIKKVLLMRQITDELPTIREHIKKVHDMAKLMECHDWRVPESQKEQVILMREGISSLEASIVLFEGDAEIETNKFALTIEERVGPIKKEVLQIREKLDHPQLSSMLAPINEVRSYLQGIQDKLDVIKQNADSVKEGQILLNQKVIEFEELNEVVNDLQIKTQLWEAVENWKELEIGFKSTLLSEVDAIDINKKMVSYGKIACQSQEKLPGNQVALVLKEWVDNFKRSLPIAVALRTPGLKDRHWRQIHDTLGFEIKGVEGLTLTRLIELRAMDHMEEIKVIVGAAQQEGVLEEMLSKVINIWSTTEFETKAYKDTKDVFILGPVDEIITHLDDSIVTINMILGSRFIAPLRELVESWKKKLVTFQDTLEEWSMVQKTWLYLESIFSAQDIQKQLPDAYVLFSTVDTSWKSLMRRTNENPLAIVAGTYPGLKESLALHNSNLDMIQKSLEDYLETKRMAFARFYFLSNDELLEILAQSRNPQAVQPHLRKCFENLVCVDFGEVIGSFDMLGMISGEGEYIPFSKTIKARGNVEDWLKALESNMKMSLFKLMKAGLVDYDTKSRDEWILDHPCQVVATVAQIAWARGTEKVFYSNNSVGGAIKEWYSVCVLELSHLITRIKESLTPLQRKMVVALITTDVHARDIVERLIEEKVDSMESFIWQQQLRYYWDMNLDDVLIQHSDSKIRYGYEYMGATTRLVITPLTDRCWMTLTGAYGLKLGAAPAGPAGTGKTESSKDLAKAMAIQCVVFNCSDQIDYKMMGKLFRGLAQAGNWACLDEFNRIDIEVLSVVAQQLLILREGRLEGKQDINFMGVQIPLKDHHVIITMNPGYAGRTELPDNLKVCFRPVSMMVPDYSLIAEIMLFAEGFCDAKTLSRKMCKLYLLCSEQLSQQPHYDYGLRAVKSVLVMAGSLKRGNPNVNEEITLIRALRDSNVPKFLENDLPLFHAIVTDLFPGVEIPSNDYGELQMAVEKELVETKLEAVPRFMAKIIQLFETLNIRFGTTLVGPTGTGKTTSYKTLQNTLTKLHLENSSSNNLLFQKIVHTFVLNPKCISMGEMYGEFNELTQEWHDGLASSLLREAAHSDTMDAKWIVFDGPIDSIWIENMNTVLDDNMTLCLANGERIKLKSEMRMLFEVMDLAVASPATVSRIGVVYMSCQDLGLLSYAKSWTTRKVSQHISSQILDRVLEYIEIIALPSIEFLRHHHHCDEPLPSVDINLISSLCTLFQNLFNVENGIDMRSSLEDLFRLTDKIFVFSLVWSIGATMTSSSWKKFDLFLRDCLHKTDQDFELPLKGLVYDYYVDTRKNEFLLWENVVPSFSYEKNLPYFHMMVPTMNTTRYSFLLETLISAMKPVYVTGVTGTGKTSIIQNLLNQLQPSSSEGGQNLIKVILNFSAQTSSSIVQHTIESKLEKKKKNLLGPLNDKKMVIFVDDVNMPTVETYGAQPPIELLRQFLDYSGFYDRDRFFWKDIQNTLLMVAAAPAGGGRSQCTPRFVRHFSILCFQEEGEDSLKLIFNSIVSGFLQDFPASLYALKEKLVESIIMVYDRVRKELLPTPSKFHYTFNLRDVSKVFQGILMIHPVRCFDTDTFHKLWIHESMRVFYDRLNTIEDQQWYRNLICSLLNKLFGVSWTEEFLFQGKIPLMFGSFFHPSLPIKYYELCGDLKTTTKCLDDYLEEYNTQQSNPMGLVFFKDAIEHTTRLSRILSQPRGNAMLIGVGGSGKRSLTHLSSFIVECDCFQIEIVRGYSLTEFREDLKKLLIQTGVLGKSTVFLFNETQIVQESFLEDINNLLNSGEVPDLFSREEMDRIIADIYPILKTCNIPETRDNALTFFVNRVRDYLHIVLCMSPVGSALRIRCRQFPSLINCCSIDWYMNWPKEALLSVATRFLGQVELPSESVRQALVLICEEIHASAKNMGNTFLLQLKRHVYTTPKSFLDLIQLYLNLLCDKRKELHDLMTKMEVGVHKLEETNAIVDGLKVNLIQLQPILQQKAAEAEELLKQVSIDRNAAALVKAKVTADEEIVGQQAKEIATLQAEAQQELDVAMPALNNALKALDSLSKSDITEIKSFLKPPEAVRTVMEAVCILLGAKTDWDTAKKLLGDPGLMDRLKFYDKENVSSSTIKKLGKYILDPSMSVEVVKKVSKAATSLCLWVHAMDVYSKVAKEVSPKQENLESMNVQLAEANAKLSEKRKELEEVREKVIQLEKQCKTTLDEKDRLFEETHRTSKRLERASKLITGLTAEGKRWKATLVTLSELVCCVVGDSLLASASLSYTGAFTGYYRDKLIELWREKFNEWNVPCSSSYSLSKTLGHPIEIMEWQLQGLPTDNVSTESALMVTKGTRWALMIDPQDQANEWIKKMEVSNGLEVTRLDSKTLLRSLENCIRFGRPLLLENVEEILEPSLDPVLQKSVFWQNGRKLLHLGDVDVDYNDSFKLYITTKLPNPHYLPEVFIKVNVINFTVTMMGLQDQLLGDVVKKELPDMEERKNHLVQSMTTYQKQLKDMEDRILDLLSQSDQNILDDEILIDTLFSSNTTSKTIKERMQETEENEKVVNQAREQYRTVATRGSILYFVVADLALIDPMYQYSLTFFQKLFKSSMDDAPKHPHLSERLERIIQYQTKAIYRNISRGLFQKHKTLFSVLLCCKIMYIHQEINPAEWQLLLHQPEHSLLSSSRQTLLEKANLSTLPKEISESQWHLMMAMEKKIFRGNQDGSFNYPFEGLLASVSQDWKIWEQWKNSPDPMKEKLPGKFESALNDIQRILLIHALVDEKCQSALMSLVSKKLGFHLVSNNPVSMEEIYNDTDSQTPCIFVLSPGADPTSMLLRLAKENGYHDRLYIVSLGQGQGPQAEKLIERSKIRGDWVLLQNCHLAQSWMPTLEKLVLRLGDKGDGCSTNFRLFLTSFPATYFPVTVLQNGMKFTNEPPKGIRANLTRSLATLLTTEEFETLEQDVGSSKEKSLVWKKLVVGLFFFHSIVQERRKFGPLGWNITYEFNDTDLETSLSSLKIFLEKQNEIPWDALIYITGEINYGGRVTDDWDRRCLTSLLKKFYCKEILDDNHKFSNSGIYYVPCSCSYEDLVLYVQTLPTNDHPEIFGMHENANICFERNESATLLKTIMSLQPLDSIREGEEGGRMFNDQRVYSLVKSIQEQIPPLFDLENHSTSSTFSRNSLISSLISKEKNEGVQDKKRLSIERTKDSLLEEKKIVDSLSTVLFQEITKFNRLLATMNTYLDDLQNAILGMIVMSKDLDAMYNSFLNNQVPHVWTAVGFASMKGLASWIEDLIFRVNFFRSWFQDGVPKAFPLSSFFFPQGFLTGTLQNYARKYQTAIDRLGFTFDVLSLPIENLKQGPLDGVYVYGMYMEGGRWNSSQHRIDDSFRGEMYSSMPILHFLPAADVAPSSRDTYLCPVYKTSLRQGTLSTTGISTNFVVAVALPTQKDPEYWILQGVALLLNLNN